MLKKLKKLNHSINNSLAGDIIGGLSLFLLGYFSLYIPALF